MESARKLVLHLICYFSMGYEEDCSQAITKIIAENNT